MLVSVLYLFPESFPKEKHKHSQSHKKQGDIGFVSIHIPIYDGFIRKENGKKDIGELKEFKKFHVSVINKSKIINLLVYIGTSAPFQYFIVFKSNIRIKDISFT